LEREWKQLFGLPGRVKWTARRVPPPILGAVPELGRSPIIMEKVFTVEAGSREEYNEKVAEALADLVWEMCQQGWQPDDTPVPLVGPVRLVRMAPEDGY
jgi:hypothetical protein